MSQPSPGSTVGGNDNGHLGSLLTYAAEANNVEDVNTILEAARTNGQFCGSFLEAGLISSAEHGCVEATECILSQGRQTIIQDHLVSPFLRAVQCNNVRVVEILLDFGAPLEVTDERGWTALMIAAWNKYCEILQLLIARGADVDARDYRKRTALHNLAAWEQSNLDNDVLDLLLSHIRDVDAQDQRGRTPLHWACATGKLSLVKRLLLNPHGPMASISSVDTQSRHPVHVAVAHSQYEVVQLLLLHRVNFHAASDDGWTPLHIACDRGDESIVLLLLKKGAKMDTTLLNGDTPLHLAVRSGHTKVVEVLLEEIDVKTWNMFGSSAFLLAAELGRKGIMKLLAPSNNIKALSQDAIRACQMFDATVVDFDRVRGNNNITMVSILNLLYGQGTGFTDLPRDTKTRFRWIHLPANNPAWVETLLIKWFIDIGAKDAKSLKSLHASLNQPHRGNYSHSRFLRPLCQTTGGNIWAFVPYLHFETVGAFRRMQDAIRQAETLNWLPRELSRDESLIRAYLMSSTVGLHTRRTLDQFSYPNMDTANRDQDQIIYRYQVRMNDPPEPKLCMVDQLWMWILQDDIVITSFPQRWEQPKNDPLDILRVITETISRSPPNSVHNLAALITDHCCGSFERHASLDDHLRVLDKFDASIGMATSKEAKLTDDLWRASTQASAWLNKYQRDDNHDDLRFVDTFLDLGPEMELLYEIKDIRDELNVIQTVLDYQRTVLVDLQDCIRGTNLEQPKSRAELKKLFNEQQKSIEVNLRELQRMDRQTERIYVSISSLLDLKQKQASPFEARLAREQAAGAARQSKTIMIFTIVTIIFLPLSFITSFFALNLAEFPHTGGVTDLHLSFVSKYIFGVGFAISIPLILFAFAAQYVKIGFRVVYQYLQRRTTPTSGSFPSVSIDQNAEVLGIKQNPQFFATRQSLETILPVSTQRTGPGTKSELVGYPTRVDDLTPTHLALYGMPH
ncbi:Ankyrin repeat and protein kinase domain-containing protein 1 [Talaromyces pinophilus]|nr:Ankyrin repeat and protein kinase domain-containing protein 1 [Talaromyces pinophilus]